MTFLLEIPGGIFGAASGMIASRGKPVLAVSSTSLTMVVVLCGALVYSLLSIVSAQSVIYPECGTAVMKLVTGGKPIIRGEYPWLAALYEQDENGKWSQFCGGALLTPRIVLTAAHCLYSEREAVKPEKIKVGLGKLYRDFYQNEDDAIITDVTHVLVPEHYLGSLSSFSLDVGLLRLNITVDLSDFIVPACIDLNTTTTVPTGSKVYAAGWGTTENGTSTEKALAAHLSYLDFYGCLIQIRLSYRKYVTHDKFCSLSEDGSQVDRGDSGGGLTFFKDGRHFIVGVVSTKITSQTTFSIFTDLSNSEIHGWLKKQIAYLRLSAPAFDCVTRLMYYWVTYRNGIVESSLDVKNYQTIYTASTSTINYGITVDWIDRKLYWVAGSQNNRSLIVFDLNTKQSEFLIPQTTTDIRLPKVHPKLRKLYLVSDQKRVESWDLDSSTPSLTTFHKEENPKVFDIAIDWQTNELCWTHGPYSKPALKCKNLLTGAYRTILADISRNNNNDHEYTRWQLAISSNNYYWIDYWRIHRLSKSTSRIETLTKEHSVPINYFTFFPESCPDFTPV